MIHLLIGFITSFFICFFLIMYKSKSHLDILEGVQKFHSWEVPRTGGLAIFLALIAVGFSFIVSNKDFAYEFFLLILCSIPVFVGGLLEDLTKKVTAKIRLLMGFVSGLLVCLLLDASLKRVDVLGFDFLIENIPIFSILFTSFALAGMSNAINIIDGFNGLASGVAIMSFFAYSYVSFLAGDQFLLYLNLCIAFSLIGFLLWNYPYGSIFLGDGGAYLVGFLTGLSGVLLVNRNPEVSAWFVICLLIYPIWETIFSIWRRKFLSSQNPFKPDSMHFHTLIHQRIVEKKLKLADPRIKNSFTSLYIWTLQILCVIPAVLFWNKTTLLILWCVAFITLYVWLYFRIVRFKTTKF